LNGNSQTQANLKTKEINKAKKKVRTDKCDLDVGIPVCVFCKRVFS